MVSIIDFYVSAHPFAKTLIPRPAVGREVKGPLGYLADSQPKEF